MKETPKIWFRFYVGDYIADTMHLTTTEHGAYLLILCHQWRQGHIPEDDLPRVARMDADAWSIAQARLKHLLSIDQAGLYFSARLDREKDEFLGKSRKAHEKAKKAAEARWKRVRERKAKGNQVGTNSDAPSIPQSNAPAMLEECQSESELSTNTSPSLRSGEGGAASPPEQAGDVTPESESQAKKAVGGSNGRGASATSQNTRMDAARHRNAVALSAKPAPVVAEAMARRLDWLLREVKEFWIRFNVPDLAHKQVLEASDLGRCPWSDRDQQAAVELLTASPGLNEVDIRRCLEHRSISIEHGWLASSLQPSKWLRDLPSFLTTPLNGFGDALPRDGGGSYKRKRPPK